MLDVKQGRVAAYRAVSKRTVQIQLDGDGSLIELTVADPWVIERGDAIAVAGRVQRRSGKFIAYAYHNQSQQVWGRYTESALAGLVLILAGLFFGFGLFILGLAFVPVGALMIYRKNRALRAFARVKRLSH